MMLGDHKPGEHGLFGRSLDGNVEILCFDAWSDGSREAWKVSMPLEDYAARLAAMRNGELCCITQDLLAGYDSDHHDAGSDGYFSLAAEVRHGAWHPLDNGNVSTIIENSALAPMSVGASL